MKRLDEKNMIAWLDAVASILFCFQGRYNCSSWWVVRFDFHFFLGSGLDFTTIKEHSEGSRNFIVIA